MQTPHSELLSLIAICASAIAIAISIWTNFRPASVHPAVSSIAVSQNGGAHLSVPISFSNSGAQSATIEGIKILETLNGKQTLWVAAFTTTPEKWFDPVLGAADEKNTALFMPFTVGPRSEVQHIVIFAPLKGPNSSGQILAADSAKVQYIFAIKTGKRDLRLTKHALWRDGVGVMLGRNSGVMNPTYDVGAWQETSPS